MYIYIYINFALQGKLIRNVSTRLRDVIKIRCSSVCNRARRGWVNLLGQIRDSLERNEVKCFREGRLKIRAGPEWIETTNTFAPKRTVSNHSPRSRENRVSAWFNVTTSSLWAGEEGRAIGQIRLRILETLRNAIFRFRDTEAWWHNACTARQSNFVMTFELSLTLAISRFFAFFTFRRRTSRNRDYAQLPINIIRVEARWQESNANLTRSKSNYFLPRCTTKT